METLVKNNILFDSHLLLMQERHKNYTVDCLAKDMKRSKKTIYKVFGSKAELIKEVFATHQSYVSAQFDEIARTDKNDIDKLISYIYQVDASIKEIRLSRWYAQAKRYVRLKEKYFEIRIDIYERYLIKGLLPFEDHLYHYQKTSQELVSFMVSSLENNYFGRSIYDIKNDTPHQYIDQLIFLIHRCLIRMEDA